MKVKELIAILEKCDPEGDVDFAYEADNPLDGSSVSDVLEIKYPHNDLSSTVVIRG